MISNSNPFPMVKVLRNDFIESIHFGDAIVIGPDENVLIEWGDPNKIIFPRSALKIIQAIPLLESGAASRYNLGEKQVAIACSSHQGSLMHTEIIKNWLQKISLSEEDLKCGIQPPSDRSQRQNLIDSGQKPSVLHNNCSGKHVSFLTFARHNNLSLEYNDVDHPLQQKIRMVLEELSGETIKDYGVDGCSAPNFRCSLRGLATAMYALTDTQRLGSTRGKSVKAILKGMYNYPLLVAGSGRACSELMMAIESPVIVKTGAEGVFVAVLPEKRIGVALKVLDGSTRASEAAIALILVRLGMLSQDHPSVIKRLFCPIKNWSGKITGYIRPTEMFWDSGKKLI